MKIPKNKKRQIKIIELMEQEIVHLEEVAEHDKEKSPRYYATKLDSINLIRESLETIKQEFDKKIIVKEQSGINT